MNMRVYEDNGIDVGIVKVWDPNVRQFSFNEFWKNICGLVLAPTFVLG